MAKRYTSKPHQINAFRFSKKKREYPDWFNAQVVLGKAQVTINKKDRFITLYGDNQKEKVFTNDWVCEADHGKLYRLTDENFQLGYK